MSSQKTIKNQKHQNRIYNYYNQSCMFGGTIDVYNNINDSNLSISLPRTIFDKYLKILHKVFKLNCLDDRVFDAILKLNKLLDNTFKSDV